MRYDVIVVGSGAAGYYSAVSCAEKGMKTAVVEMEELGGTAFRWGSLAVKRVLDSFRRVDEDLLREAGIRPEEYYKKEYRRAVREMPQIEEKIDKRLRKRGIDIYSGEAVVGEMQEGYRKVAMEGKVIYGKTIVLATGTTGKTLWRGEAIVTHRELLGMEDLPEKICIVGGSVEGIELATITAYMGIETVVIEGEGEVLKGTERDLVVPVEEKLQRKGVRFLLGNRVEGCRQDSEGIEVRLDNGKILRTDLVVVTGMRNPNIPKGVEAETTEGFIKVDENYRTTTEGIYAVGDINGIMGMANAARYQGEQIGNILGGKRGKSHPESLSRAIYTIPEIACTGFQGKMSGRGEFKDTFRGWSKEIAGGFIVVYSDDSETICGISMSGEDVSEYLGALGYLVDRRVSLEEARGIMMAHPTMMEAFHDAVEDVINN